MLINLFEIKEIHDSFCKVYNIPPVELDAFISKCNSEDDLVSKFCESFDFKLDGLDISSNELVCRHITTTFDDCKSFSNNGFMSLIELLKTDSILNVFLKENGVVIDIDKMTLKYKDNTEVSLAQDDCGNLKKLSRLSIALNHDKGEVEAFYCGDLANMLGYSTVSKHPEVLEKIDGAISELYGKDVESFSDKWIKQGPRTFMIEFSVPINNISYCTGKSESGMWNYKAYIQGTYEYINSYPQSAVINKWLINSMLNCLVKKEINHTCSYVGIKNPKLIRIIDINNMDEYK
ncbi:hypothetical protein [Butyrivibrio fibrisolvens]|uniref:hypothetical protein n=1 Tax=Butyrivibrio fibrisolvens TaxID=831 RepID=UPI0003B5E11E|nr:hypothetical protein [Butyrivibrio fibrisolvens]